MKKLFFSLSLLLSISLGILAQTTVGPFTFIPTSTLAGVIATVEINGVPATGSDVLAAVDANGNIAGATMLVVNSGQAFANLTIYGDDTGTPGVDEGITGSESFTFQLFVSSTNQTLNFNGTPNTFTNFTNTNGSPLPGFAFADDVVLNFTTAVGVGGCIDMTACNFNAAATDDDGSCVFASTVATDCETCSGETDGTGTVVVSDADGDGVCDADEIAGCTNAMACNFNTAATDDNGSCVMASTVATDCETCSGATDGTGTVVVSDADGDGVCDADEIAGCTDATACNFNAAATDDNGSCVFASTVATDCETCSGATDGTGTVVVSDADGDGVCDADETGGCTDMTACNFDAAATETDNTLCVFASTVATDCETCSGGAVVVSDADGDGVCDADEVAGCTDATACNFNAAATDDNGSCVFASTVATDCEACSGATDGTGTVVVSDADGDGVCDADEAEGCTDMTACNFNAAATETDNTLCVYATAVCDTCSGETDGSGTVVIGDVDGNGICDVDEIVGCMDPTACNFDPTANVSGTCDFFPCTAACGNTQMNITAPSAQTSLCASGADAVTLTYNSADNTSGLPNFAYVVETPTGLVYFEGADGDTFDLDPSALGLAAGDITCVSGVAYDLSAVNTLVTVLAVESICLGQGFAQESCDIIANVAAAGGLSNLEESITFVQGLGLPAANSMLALQAVLYNVDLTAAALGGVCYAISNGGFGNDFCYTVEICGCTDPTACNFNADATSDDGSCDPFPCTATCGNIQANLTPIAETTVCASGAGAPSITYSSADNTSGLPNFAYVIETSAGLTYFEGNDGDTFVLDPTVIGGVDGENACVSGVAYDLSAVNTLVTVLAVESICLGQGFAQASCDIIANVAAAGGLANLEQSIAFVGGLGLPAATNILSLQAVLYNVDLTAAALGGVCYAISNNGFGNDYCLAIETCFVPGQDGLITREGALLANSNFPLNGDEVYCWFVVENGVVSDTPVATFTGNPYYSPTTIGTFTVIVKDPDFPDFPEMYNNYTIDELNGCCELPGDN